ncbi:hypothetical protein DICPUDRAFT_150801 [Dictyostelium purpureum]|uniref:Methyltransferase domain-containing protein n=1 Tax=Dictyostelium purpureum TaxID=5786 RepID=F0ZHA2_DICPU|nr:uncharacterized protein DICPUDRAFT_150801 [Dictyostelium purpureum]EGC36691.1 hypothetical protein DICPUDRAFT_150801 [Dictyostelium purpureum]|eukprot:XP_003286790.1 hypothetical protein DICPUDRAFT_150801 [Dictyostelium purpureum]
MASTPQAVELLSRFGFTSQFSVEALKLTAGDQPKPDNFKILDVATGTGTLSLFASSIFKNADIIASDFSPNMISILDQIIKEDGITNIKTKVEDGMNMKDYNNDTFDYCYSMFGLIYFPDRVKGLKEMHRVLKPNGKVAIGSWQENQYLASLLSETYEQLMGKPLPIEQPIISMSDKDQFKKEMEEAGFKNVEIHSITKYFKESKTYEEILNKGNPPVDDVINIIPNEKKQNFDQIFFDIAKKRFPRKTETETIKLSAPAFIGIGYK